MRCRDRPDFPVEMLSMCFARIEARNASIRAVLDLDRTRAERAAEASAARWANGMPLSQIDGAPVLVKANFAVAGLPWHAGIAAYGDRIAIADAPIVERLRQAGAIVMGLTNMDEGALGASGENAWLGSIGNPHRPGFSPGGSSGGSAAAVASGFCLAALSSDTIGSVAIPAACCGVVGHRASRSRFATKGIVPLSPSFDHGGWHSQTAGSARTLYVAIGGRENPAERSRIAALSCNVFGTGPGLDDAMAHGAERLREAGETVSWIELPKNVSDVARRLFEVAEAEAAGVHRQALRDRGQGFSAAFLRMMEWGATQGARRLTENKEKLSAVAAEIRMKLSGFDALLLPAMPNAGYAAGSRPPPNQAMFAALPACLGWPATTIPAKNQNGFALLVTAPTDRTCLRLADQLSAQ